MSLLLSLFEYFFTFSNILIWICVLIPQLKLNYKYKSAEAISVILVYYWLLGNIMSLISGVFIKASLNIIIISSANILMDLVFFLQILYYKYINRTKLNESYLLIIIPAIIIIIILFLPKEIIILLYSWGSVTIFVVGKIPQIYLTYTRKTTEGLSLTAFSFVLLSNTCYIFSLIFSLTQQSDQSKFIKTNLPWLISCLISSFFDIIILLQFYVYKERYIDLESYVEIM